jgi:hypothetical protein
MSIKDDLKPINKKRVVDLVQAASVDVSNWAKYAPGAKMKTNPYADSEQLAEALWEAELVADKYLNSGLILIRTKDGWRAFLGNFQPEALVSIEKALDENVPSMEQMFTVSRKPNLAKELWRLLLNCMCFDGYRPMKLTEELEDEKQ